MTHIFGQIEFDSHFQGFTLQTRAFCGGRTERKWLLLQAVLPNEACCSIENLEMAHLKNKKTMHYTVHTQLV